MLLAGRESFVRELLSKADPGRPALIEGDEYVTYGELAARVTDRAADLAIEPRQVVVLAGSNTLEYVVTYLALLWARHVPLLTAGHVDRLVEAWRPAATVHAGAGGIEVRRHDPAPRELHPDLALLLSTSGSTGSPKLVRLSDRNLASNARAIAEFLGLTAADRAVTSLPLHYCYGLSVLHSHLAAGASVVLTDTSVVDPCFAAALDTHGVTNVAGVPHTFELLERAGPDRIHVPTLRLVTQAGGRLAPNAVERWARRLEQWGAAFYVMYGQTEATARMAYLPPDLARRHPGAIGMPIPGGSLEIRPVDGMPGDVGELVYRGPNVMLGYATDDGDLALGATLTELRTGDLGRFHAEDGVYEIVGRQARFVKPFGVRVDLDAVERELARRHPEVAVSGDDSGIVVIAPGAPADAVRDEIGELVGVPRSLIAVDTEGPVPRTATGKIDYDAVRRTGAARREATAAAGRQRSSSVAAVFAAVLGRADVGPASTFISLGGDSLNYVECALRLEAVLGSLPPDWHLLTVAELEAAGRGRRLPRLDTTTALRAVGICAVVSTHMGLLYFPGGAHLLLALAGFNLSRFQLPIAATVERVRAAVRTVSRVAVPTVLWAAGAMLVARWYSAGTLLLVNNYAGPRTHDNGRWHFWFIEVFVHLTLITTAVLAIPAVRRVERRFPYWFALAAFVGLLLLRMEWADLNDWYNLRFRTHGVAWFFALGWLVHQSRTWWQRGLTSAACLLTIPGFFGRPEREWFIAGGLLLLLWLRDLPIPRPAARPLALLAAASMWILITHFAVWPPLDRLLPQGLAFVVTLAVGVVAWAIYERLSAAVRRLLAAESVPTRMSFEPRVATIES